MASEQFEVDTEGLHKQMPYVRQLAARFRGVGTSLEARLGALGRPWGDDEAGQQFLEAYDNPHRQILDGVGQTGEVLDSTADGITTMATNYRRLEEENIAAARSLDTGSGSGSGSGEDTRTPRTAPEKP